MARTFPTCGLWVNGDEVRLWIGDTEGAESVLTDDQIDAFIRNLEGVKQLRTRSDADVTWIRPNAPTGDDMSDMTDYRLM